MQSTSVTRRSIISDIENLEDICKRTKYCKDCVAYKSVEGLKILDFIGCPFTNYVIRNTEEYQFQNKYNRALDFSLINLTKHNQVEAVMSEDHMPNKEGILYSLNQLKLTLGKTVEKEDKEIEELLVQKDPTIHTVSRKAAPLLK